MPRILGVDIPKEKRIEISLTYIFGIGRTLSNKVLKTAGIDTNTRAKDLDKDQISRIASILQTDYTVEGELRRDIQQNIRRLMDINSYVGNRHKRNLPVHGQRTKTNARTRKGPRKGHSALRNKK